MADKYCLVVNPAARRGRNARLLPQVLGPLAAAGATIRVRESSSLAHAAEVAAEAVGLGETVVAVGGDGTVGRLAAAVADAGGVLGIIPAGRGNDFARMLGIPAQPARAAAVLLAGPRQAVDLIGVRAGNGPELVVAGSVYLGILSEAAQTAQGSRLTAVGNLGYQVAGLRALRAWQRTRFTVGTLDGPPAGFGGFCVVVANSAYVGAGTAAAPAASLTDGLLDVITVGDGPKLSFVRVMLNAARGTHLRLDQVGAAQAAAVTVTADRAVLAGADGETLPFAAPLAPGSPLSIRVLPGVLQVLAPATDGATAPGRGGGAGANRARSGGAGARRARGGQLSAGLTGRRPPRKDSTKSGLDESSAGVPSILTSPPPST
jgi:diacylglycerol kinase (ATP)